MRGNIPDFETLWMSENWNYFPHTEFIVYINTTSLFRYPRYHDLTIPRDPYKSK